MDFVLTHPCAIYSRGVSQDEVAIAQSDDRAWYNRDVS
jgi:hypothetical protein